MGLAGPGKRIRAVQSLGFEGWQVLSGFSFGGVGFSLGLSVSGEVGLGAGADKRANPFLCEPGQKVSRELLRTAELEPKTLHAETSRALLNRP